MLTLWLIAMIVLLAATTGTLIALRIQYQMLEKARQERTAWEQAQESRQRTWEVRQGKHIVDVEKKLIAQVKEIRRDWQEWSGRAQSEPQAMNHHSDIEHELARLPHVEDVALPFGAHSPRQQPDHWRPPLLYKADLRERDLSHRYMGYADLRAAQLHEANCYMTDLSGASLSGANLEQANLAGASLVGADLRGARLSGANLLVADLHNTILLGADLRAANNLTRDQLQTAIYDSTTLIDTALVTESANAAQSTAEQALTVDENDMTIRLPMIGRQARRTPPDQLSDTNVPHIPTASPTEAYSDERTRTVDPIEMETAATSEVRKTSASMGRQTFTNTDETPANQEDGEKPDSNIPITMTIPAPTRKITAPLVSYKDSELDVSDEEAEEEENVSNIIQLQGRASKATRTLKTEAKRVLQSRTQQNRDKMSHATRKSKNSNQAREQR